MRFYHVKFQWFWNNNLDKDKCTEELTEVVGNISVMFIISDQNFDGLLLVVLEMIEILLSIKDIKIRLSFDLGDKVTDMKRKRNNIR